jgi:hypothetical protein
LLFERPYKKNLKSLDCLQPIDSDGIGIALFLSVTVGNDDKWPPLMAWRAQAYPSKNKRAAPAFETLTESYQQARRAFSLFVRPPR